VNEFPADISGRNNLAVSEFMLLNFDQALEQGQRVVAIWPGYVLGRTNLALFAMYAGRFDAAAQYAHDALRLSNTATTAYIPLGVGAGIEGRDDDAIEWYRAMGRTGARGAWLAELALADLDAARGRTAEARQRLLDRVDQDERAGNTTAAARHYAFLAELAAGEQRPDDVAGFVERGRRMSSDPQFTYRFALALLDVGRRDEARKVADTLSTVRHARGPLYWRALSVELSGPTRDHAAETLRAAQETGTWWAYHRAAVVLARARAPEAAEALRWCLDHRPQGVSAFLDDVPTIRYYVAVGTPSR
jgi:tetratricopeptide (TPR) repeat protein